MTLWVLIVCSAGWHDCTYEGRVPAAQCQSMMNMAIESMPCICIDPRGEVFRTREVWASK